MKSRRTLLIFFVFVLIAGIPVGWYLLSPLFFDRTVNESFPTRGAGEVMDKTMPEEVKVEATAAMEEAMEDPDKVMEEPMPEDVNSMSILVQGSFYDIAHHGMGTATVYQLEDGSRVLRFENFEVLNGPQLHVYLAPIDPVPDTVGVEIEGAIDLGALKGNIGDQNYELPSGLDISLYNSVVIWCVPFRVPFNAAPLTSP